MPRPRPPHLQRERTRHGRIVWFVRVYPGRRTRLRQEYGTPEFWAAYDAAIAGNAPPEGAKAPNGTLAWLIDQYRQVDAWRSLSEATRRQRENIFKQVIKSAGRERYAAITRAMIVAGRERRSRRRRKLGTLSRRCAACSNGPLTPITLRPIRPPTSQRRRAKKPAVSRFGPRTKSTAIVRIGRLAQRNGFG